MRAYPVCPLIVLCLIYAVVVHWVWSTKGELNASNTAGIHFGTNGMLDFTGDAVVH